MTVYNFNSSNDNNYVPSRTDFRSDVEQIHSMLSVHNPDANDTKTVKKFADETINISGAMVDVYVRTDNADYDNVWREDPNPTYWNPFKIKAFFKPEPLESELQSWGVDTSNTTAVVFSYNMLYEKLGERMLRPGDVLQLPYNSHYISPKNYRVTNATPVGNYRYNWLYFECRVETLTADVVVRVEEDLLDNNDDDYDNGVYRESI